MKRIKLYEEFVNEAKALDPGLAQITVNYLIKNKSEFKEEIWMSAFDRDDIKSAYGSKLPRGFASNNISMLVGDILEPLGYDAYVDGNELVVGDKTVLKLKGKETWEDIAKVLNLKE